MSFRRPDLRCLAPQDRADGLVFRTGPFLEPIHLVGLASAAHGAAQMGRHTRIEVHDGAASYAARMRLGSALDDAGCLHRLPAVREHAQAGRLLEVSAIHDPEDVRSLAHQVRERVRRRSRDAADGLYDAITEMGINVHEHAHPAAFDLRAEGFIAAQTMHRVREWVFAVADFGVGMRETLRDRGLQPQNRCVWWTP